MTKFQIPILAPTLPQRILFWWSCLDEQVGKTNIPIFFFCPLLHCLLIFSRLNLDMVPRVEGGEVVDADDISVVELYNVHVACSERIAPTRNKTTSPNNNNNNYAATTKQPSVRDTRKFRPHSITMKRNSTMLPSSGGGVGGGVLSKGPTASHLLLTYKSFICDVPAPLELCFGIYDSNTACFIR